jgi:hypothetical protein
MLEATRLFLSWFVRRVRTGSPVHLSIRDTFILYVGWSCFLGSLLLGLIVYGIERGAGGSVAYVDCLFHVASAVSSTGLITLDTSALQRGSNGVIFLSMLVFANTLLVTQVPVVLRICRVRASIAARDATARALAARGAALGAAGADLGAAAELDEAQKRTRAAMIALSDATVVEAARGRQSRMKMPFAKRPPTSASSGANDSQAGEGTGAALTLDALVITPSSPPHGPSPPLPDAGLAEYAVDAAAHARHSAALASFLAQPDFLGYHWCLALALLYYVTIVLAGFVAFCSWGAASASARALLERNATPAGGTSLPWFAAYHSLSLFTNTGMMMISDNMVQFALDTFFVVTSGVIAALGFSLYPLGLRVFVTAVHAALPACWITHKAAVGDLLAHPRKYTSHLFSASGTLALTLASIGAQALLFAVFLGCDFNSEYFTNKFPHPKDRAMNGWFFSVMVCVPASS